ncbi:hypothetical protein Y032_0114g436 [Ancylostoma ceylanicum]|nr:hypothetical protein Y032_0114g436 [Ancylostoma ceylanicum]
MFIEFAPQLNSSVMQRIKNGQEDPPPFDVGGNPSVGAIAEWSTSTSTRRKESVGTVCSNAKGGLVPTVYMTPHPRSAKNGSQQFNELYNGLVNICHITIRRVWIEVPTSSNWPADSSKNVAFLNDIVTAAKKQSISFQIGIFTNQFDWDHITFGAKELSKGLKLWYWKSPAGSRTPPNFDDFRPFSSWTAPDAKQFATKVSECGIIVNRNVYKA